MKERSALVIGGTGLVGKELVKILIDSSEYNRIILLLRRPSYIIGDKVTEKLIDFDNMEAYKEMFSVDHVFCTLGTTIKKAKTREAFKRVDHGYPVKAAKISREMGVRKFLVISAIGANPESKIFYNRIKGLLEEDIKKIGFNTVHIFRPSLLIGSREEFRFGENAAAVVSKLFPFIFAGKLKKYKPVRAETVANAMYENAVRDDIGIFVHESEELK